MLIFLPIISALLMRLAGSDWKKPWTGKYAMCAVLGVIAGGMHAPFAWDGLIISAIVFVGLALWRGPGWGKGFAAQYGYWEGRELGAEGIRKGVLWMTLRGLLVVPLFAGLALYLERPEIVLYGLVGALQGVVYWLPARVITRTHQDWAYRRRGNPLWEMMHIPGAFSETVMGALIGAALGWSIYYN